MVEFRKRLDLREIESGAIFWDEGLDEQLKAVIPQTLVFDLIFEDREYVNLSVEWKDRRFFIGEPVTQALPGSELVLTPAKDKPLAVECTIYTPQEKMVIRKRLSHHEHSRRFLKWFAREDELYERLFSFSREFIISIEGKEIKAVAPDFEKRNLYVGEALRFFSPGDDLLIHWSREADFPTLVIEREEIAARLPLDGTTSLRSLVTNLLSRPLESYNEGEVKGLIVLLDENKKLWERISQYQEENRRLKEQVNMLESLFEQFASNSFFNSKKEFESWVANHLSKFEAGLRVIHQKYSVTLSEGRKRRIDLLCQDKKGFLVVVQNLFNPDSGQVEEAISLMNHLRSNIETFGSELTKGQLKAADIRGMIIANHEKADLVEQCLQQGIKLGLVKSGCLIDIME
jgi:hypothetical protein